MRLAGWGKHLAISLTLAATLGIPASSGALAAAPASSPHTTMPVSPNWRSSIPDVADGDPAGMVVMDTTGRMYAFGVNDTVCCVPKAITEMYDPTSNTWSQMAPMPTPRKIFAAVLGPDKRIYVIGGVTSGSTSDSLSTMEAYTPSSNTWAELAPMPTPRHWVQAVVGLNGLIYVLGGRNAVGNLNTVEAYNIKTNTWITRAPMSTPRAGLAVAINRKQSPTGPTTGEPYGLIYAIGGVNDANGDPLNSVEAYNTQTDTWITVASLNTARLYIYASTGQDGRIYVVGGGANFNINSALNTAEVYDPTQNTWSYIANMPTPRMAPKVVTGVDGRIYAIGGTNATGALASVDIYDPRSNRWEVPNMLTPRAGFAAVTSPDGQVYTIGGYTNSGILATVEAYTPSSNTWAPLPSLRIARKYLAAVSAGGSVYALGGLGASGVLNSVEVYQPTIGTWNAGTAMPTARSAFAAATGPDGRIYAIGGVGATSYLKTVEIYDPTTGRWSTGAPMPTARGNLAAATGADGRIYAIGGYGPGGILHTAEAYDPKTNTWAKVASVPTARYGLAAVAGPDGRIYAIGGTFTPDTSGILNVVEAYSPQTKRWTRVHALTYARKDLAVAAGLNGQLYALGGTDTNGNPVPVVEAYGPGIGATPAQSLAGSTVIVTGSNFAPHATVNVYWGATTGTLLVTVSTDSLGSFIGNGYVTIPKVGKGIYTITAVDSKSKYPVTMAFTVTG